LIIGIPVRLSAPAGTARATSGCSLLELKAAVGAGTANERRGGAASGAGWMLAVRSGRHRANRRNALPFEHRGPLAVQELCYGLNIVLLDQEVCLGASAPAGRGRRGDRGDPRGQAFVPDFLDIG
jgi:hypothetical protein